MIDVTTFPAILQLRPVGEHLYEGEPEHGGDRRNVVFGGQILAQMIVAAHLDRNVDRADDKEVKSIHAIFARAGDYTQPIAVRGRADARRPYPRQRHGDVLPERQDHVAGPDPLEHRRARPHPSHRAVEMPTVPGPDDRAQQPGRPGLSRGRGAHRRRHRRRGATTSRVGPAVQNVWTRFTDNYSARRQPGDPVVGDRRLADRHLHAAARRRSTQDQAHSTISTGVVAHTLNFHERFEADEWLLLANESIWAGRGRTHGRCNIWTQDGRLVATYTQDNLVRGFADSQDHTGDYKRIM